MAGASCWSLRLQEGTEALNSQVLTVKQSDGSLRTRVVLDVDPLFGNCCLNLETPVHCLPTWPSANPLYSSSSFSIAPWSLRKRVFWVSFYLMAHHSSWYNSAFFNTRDAQLKTSTVKSTHFFWLLLAFSQHCLFLRDEDIKPYKGIQHFLPNSSFCLLGQFANLFLSWSNQISWWSIRSLAPSSSC